MSVREFGIGYLYYLAVFVAFAVGAWFFGPIGGLIVALVFITVMVWRLVSQVSMREL